MSEDHLPQSILYSQNNIVSSKCSRSANEGLKALIEVVQIKTDDQKTFVRWCSVTADSILG